MPQPSETFKVNILNAMSAQTLPELFFVKLWIISGAGDGAHIDYLLDLKSIQYANELIDRMS